MFGSTQVFRSGEQLRLSGCDDTEISWKRCGLSADLAAEAVQNMSNLRTSACNCCHQPDVPSRFASKVTPTFTKRYTNQGNGYWHCSDLQQVDRARHRWTASKQPAYWQTKIRYGGSIKSTRRTRGLHAIPFSTCLHLPHCSHAHLHIVTGMHRLCMRGSPRPHRSHVFSHCKV
jgi:hypothetical protein